MDENWDHFNLEFNKFIKVLICIIHNRQKNEKIKKVPSK